MRLSMHCPAWQAARAGTSGLGGVSFDHSQMAQWANPWHLVFYLPKLSVGEAKPTLSWIISNSRVNTRRTTNIPKV